MNKIKLLIHSLKQMLGYLLSSKDKVLYVGGYPTIPNVGDVALFMAYEKYFSDYKVIHFRGGKLERLFYRVFFRSKDKVVLAGGTLINHMCLREATDAFNTFGPFYVLGTGVAQSSYWKGRPGYLVQEEPWANILKSSPYVGVRGPLSQDQLTQFGVNSEVFGDPVLFLAELRELGSSKTFGEEKTIGLNIGRSLGNVQGGEENLKGTFIKTALKLKDMGYHLKWFVVCPEDLEITLEISKVTSGLVIKVYKDYSDYFKELDNCSVFLGTKLHAVCLALCYSIPSIMIEYRPKCRDFMASLDLQGFSLPADSSSAKSITSKIKDIENNYQDLVSKINSNIDKFKKFQEEKLRELFVKE